MPLKERVAATKSRAGQQQQPAPDKAATEHFLHSLFSYIISDAASNSSSPWLVVTAAQLTGQLAAWLGKASNAPVGEVLKYLLQALGQPAVSC